jgi:Restriction endonuclease
MPAYSPAILQSYFSAGDNASTKAEKGKALEDLACYLFMQVPGVSLGARNTMNAFDTEEIDVAFWNEQHSAGFKAFDPILLVECKNWSKPVGSEEVNWFLSKIEHRGERFGVLLAANGITGDAQDATRAHQVVALFLLKKIRLVVITRAEVLKLASSEELVRLIKWKVCQLVASGTVWP